MYKYSPRSRENLESCHPKLQMLFNKVIKHWDCSIIEGHRGQERQDQLFAQKKSKLKWPQGKHNTNPSRAVDVMSYPIDWNDNEMNIAFGHFVMGMATGMGIKLRWGGDWNGNRRTSDERFFDSPHFELLDSED